MNKEALYGDLQKAFNSILMSSLPWESALVSLIALLKDKLSYTSWVGFYRLEKDVLWVGPYQGPLACLRIPLGEGVCGVTAKEEKVQIVPDVHAFEGHIACDASSRSEIVLPVYRSGKLIGVLDLDSHDVEAFDETDQKGIEAMLSLLPT